MGFEKDKSPAKVGYGRPPEETRFKKGQSGNPAGRPRKGSDQKAIVEKVLGEEQRLNGQPQGERVWFSNLELVMMTLKQAAASGCLQATKLYEDQLAKYGNPQADVQPTGYIIVPETLTEEEWEAKYSPKDALPHDDEWSNSS